MEDGIDNYNATEAAYFLGFRYGTVSTEVWQAFGLPKLDALLVGFRDTVDPGVIIAALREGVIHRRANAERREVAA